MVVHKYWFDRKCPPFWPSQFAALHSHPKIEAVLTGPRWDGYDNNETLAANVDRIMPDADVVYLWRPLGIAEFGGVKQPELPLRALKVSSYQDDQKDAVKEALTCRLDLAFYHDLWDARFWKACSIPSSYLPLAVDLQLFKRPPPINSRKLDGLLTGNTNKTTYPFRAKLEYLIRCRRLPGQVRRTSPYRMDRLEDIHAEQIAYANQLLSAKIAYVTTSPLAPLTMRKYFEAAAAGCVLVGEMPHSPPAGLRDLITQVSATEPAMAMTNRVYKLLLDPKRLEYLSSKTLEFAQNYGYNQFAERWFSRVSLALQQQQI